MFYITVECFYSIIVLNLYKRLPCIFLSKLDLNSFTASPGEGGAQIALINAISYLFLFYKTKAYFV